MAITAGIDEGVIVFIVCDNGWKYLSTGAYTDDLDAAEAKAEGVVRSFDDTVADAADGRIDGR